MGLDEQTEISAIDKCITKLKLQNAMQDTFAAALEANQGCLQQVTDLATWKALVTPFVSIGKCEWARRQLLTLPGADRETDLLEAVKIMLTSTKYFEASPVSTTANTKTNFSTWKRNVLVQLKDMTKSVYQEIQGDVTKIQSWLLDLDHLSRPANVDECIETLRHWDGEADLMNVLKGFQGAGGRGLKQFDVFLNTLSCAGISSPGLEMQAFVVFNRPANTGEAGQTGLSRYRKVYQDLVKVRQAARLQLSLRSAAIIIHAKDAPSVANSEKDIKPLKVTIPKAIKEKLSELKK